MSTAWTITFDCAEPATLAAFWRRALGYVDGAPPAGAATWEGYLASVGVPPEEWGDGAYIEDPAGLRPGISFLKVPEAKTAKNRIHLDVQAGGGRGEPQEVRAPEPDGSGGSDCPCDQRDGRCAPPDDDAGPDDDEPDDDGPDGDGPDDDEPDGDGPDGDGPDDDEPDGDGPGDGGPNGRCPEPGNEETHGPDGGTPPGSPAPPKLTDLTVPLAALLGPPRRPGESHGFGPLDPALCRALAALAAASPHTTACVTVTDHHGHATGHGCLSTGRRRRAPLPGAPGPPLTALPARLNLTITATRLAKLLEPAGQPRPPGPASPTGWALAKSPAPDPPGPPDDPPWCGTWIITLPSGLQYQVPVEPVPTRACDHRRESRAYEPNDMLRHLVQIRDYECTLPTCSRHAKESDFEHAVPYDQGGRTCACNAGARSRACHQVKQSPGWKATQPKPGWHQWQTPSGRTYTQEPKRYPT